MTALDLAGLDPMQLCLLVLSFFRLTLVSSSFPKIMNERRRTAETGMEQKRTQRHRKIRARKMHEQMKARTTLRYRLRVSKVTFLDKFHLLSIFCFTIHMKILTDKKQYQIK